MIIRRLASFAFLALVSLGGSCAELPSLPRGTCDNGVIDKGEECDTFAPKGQRCRRANEQNACRFDCVSAACPTGWACSPSSGICLQPTGTFRDAPSSSFEANAWRMSFADFDGDKRSDLLVESAPDAAGQSTVRIFYFDDPAQPPSKTVSVAAATMSPVAYDVDKDGRADLLFSTFNRGMNLMLGRADRTLSPVAYARFPFPPGARARFVRVRGMKDSFFNQMPIVFAMPAPGFGVIAPGASEGNPFDKPLGKLDDSPEKILGEPIAANIVDGLGNECEEIVWGNTGSDTIQWFAPCKGNSFHFDKTRSPQPLFSLPKGETLARPPVAVDLNADGHVDLLVTSNAHSYVAFGRGNGTFSANSDLGPSVRSMAEIDCDILLPDDSPIPGGVGTDCTGAPLAAHVRSKDLAPLTSDISLIVFPNYLLHLRNVRNKPASGKVTIAGAVLAVRSNGAWSSAHIADFNGNGLYDVVAASDGATDIDFFNGTPFGVFNASRITTRGPVTWLDAGDFDGDLVTDLAFVEAGGGGTGVDAISIAYGRFMAPPEAPIQMGTFPNIRQIATAKMSGLDAMEQIGVLYEGESDLIAILEGSGDRQLLAPYGLATQLGANAIQAYPYLNAAGKFDGDDHVDAVMLAHDADDSGDRKPGALRFWFAGGKGAGRFVSPIAEGSKKGFGLVSGDADARAQVIALTRSGDIDRDGRDELVLLAPQPNKHGATLTVVKKTDAADNPVSQTTVPIALAGEEVWRRFDFELADVDGDGNLDAVIQLHRDTASTMLIAWGDGKGAFDMISPALITLPKEAGEMRTFCVVQLDLDPAKELAIAAEHGIYVVHAPSRAVKVDAIPGLPGGELLATGDLNLDGIPDLAVASNNRISIHLGVPKTP